MRYRKPKALSPSNQLLGLKKYFSMGKGHVKRNCLRWECKIRPTPLSRDYDVRVIYRLDSQPSIFMVNPSLKTFAGQKEIPHLYSQEKEEICLYRPRYKEWTPNQHIAKTIVPWIYSWLFYFEEWLVSEKWKGGGEHPRPRSSRRRKLQ